VANLTAAEMYTRAILIQLVVPSYSSAISFTYFISPHCCTCLNTRSIFLDYTIYNAVFQTCRSTYNCCPDILHLNCGLLRFILFPYAAAARPNMMARLIAVYVKRLSPDDCPISFSELQPKSSTLGKDIRGRHCFGVVLARPNPA
jgi:hypothetical protein